MTWKVRRWSEGAVAPKLRGFREGHGDTAVQVDIRGRYGEAVADAVEMYAAMFAERLQLPRMQDIKATLEACMAKPEKVDAAALDQFTSGLLISAGYRISGRPDLYEESLALLAQCAKSALEHLPKVNGRPTTDPLAELLVFDVLRLAPPDCDRDALLADALTACRLQNGRKNIERLRKKAGQVF